MKLPNLLATRNGRLATFFALYLTEGIPLGFTATAVATQMRRQGLGPVRLVGEHLGQPGHPAADTPEHLDGPVPVDRGRRQHRQAPDQAERINQQVPLAPGDLFSPRRSPSGRRPRSS